MEMETQKTSKISLDKEIQKNAFYETLSHDIELGTIQYEFINDTHKLNPKIALKALEFNNDNIRNIPKELLSDKEFILKTISINPRNLIHSNSEFKDNYECMKSAILINSKCFEYGSVSIRSNRELCLLSMNNSSNGNNPLFFASQELKCDKELVKLCVSQGEFRILQQTHLEYLENKEIALSAVKKDGCALKYFKKPIKMDEDVCLEAVKQNSKAYYYINRKMKYNKEIILETLKKDETIFPYIYKQFKKKYGHDISDFILSMDDKVKLDKLENDRINEIANRKANLELV